MSLALTKQLEITKDFEENKEIMMKEAVYQFPNETPEHAYTMLLRKHIDDEIKEAVVAKTMEIVDLTNGLRSPELAGMMLEGVLRSHRYLQGEFWNTMIHLMKKYAESDRKYFDPQNENSRKMCEEIVKNWLR
jgi:hypothetical protein